MRVEYRWRVEAMGVYYSGPREGRTMHGFTRLVTRRMPRFELFYTQSVLRGILAGLEDGEQHARRP